MTEADVECVIERAREQYPDERPHSISDNGPQFIARDFKEYIRVSLSHCGRRVAPAPRRALPVMAMPVASCAGSAASSAGTSASAQAAGALSATPSGTHSRDTCSLALASNRQPSPSTTID